MTAVERGLIQAGLKQAEIARSIGRDPSVVSRELSRDRPDGFDCGSLAHARAYARVRRLKEFRLLAADGFCRRIEAAMDDGWSPRLIAQALAVEAGGDKTRTVSHETI